MFEAVPGARRSPESHPTETLLAEAKLQQKRHVSLGAELLALHHAACSHWLTCDGQWEE